MQPEHTCYSKTNTHLISWKLTRTKTRTPVSWIVALAQEGGLHRSGVVLENSLFQVAHCVNCLNNWRFLFVVED